MKEPRMRVYPVVHILEPKTAVDQGEKALDAGANGVYLIDHHREVNDNVLFGVFDALETRCPDMFIGVNPLRAPLASLISIERAVATEMISRPPDALWADDALDERRPFEAIEYRDQSEHLDLVQYLGGIAFKYTPSFTEDPERAAQLAASFHDRVDIVTTSGVGTGRAPTIEKLQAMKASIDGELAVASGVSARNVHQLHGIVDKVLVATSIETEPYSGVFDDRRLKALIKAVHQG